VYVALRTLKHEGALTRAQLLRLDWHWVRLLAFVLLWPGVIIAAIAYGFVEWALRELYNDL